MDNEPAPCRKERQIVTVGDKAPKAPRREQHHQNSERAEKDEIPGPEIGEIALQKIEDNGADGRPLHRSDTANDDNEDHIGGPIQDREGSIR